MAINYTRAQALAQKLITANGRTVTLRTIRDTAPLNPDAPWEVATPTITTYSVTACFVPKDARSSPANQGMEPRTTDHIETRIMLLDGKSLDALGVVPNLKDEIVDGGTTWTITLINPFQPAGLTILYEMNVEK